MGKSELNSASSDCRECKRLQSENQSLKQENSRLKRLLLEFGHVVSNDCDHPDDKESVGTDAEVIHSAGITLQSIELTSQAPVMYHVNEDNGFENPIGTATVTKSSPVEDKVALFHSLFRGRDDIFAKRWVSAKNGKPGYSPSCLNEWEPGVCRKPKINALLRKHFFRRVMEFFAGQPPLEKQ